MILSPTTETRYCQDLLNMHFLYAPLSPLLKHLYASLPATLRQAKTPQPPVNTTYNPSQQPRMSSLRPVLPPRKSSLCAHRQQIIRSIERSIILHDRYILLRSCNLSKSEPTFLDYWHLDLLHDLLICRYLISPEACQKILDQRDSRAEAHRIWTYIKTKVALEHNKATSGSVISQGSWLPCCGENTERMIQEYEV